MQVVAKGPDGHVEPVTPPEAAKAAPKKNERDKLAHTATDRGWIEDPHQRGGYDVAYSKSNPVLGGYERVKLNFTGSGAVEELVHDNLNKIVPVPEDKLFEHATHILTGEWPDAR